MRIVDICRDKDDDESLDSANFSGNQNKGHHPYHHLNNESTPSLHLDDFDEGSNNRPVAVSSRRVSFSGGLGDSSLTPRRSSASGSLSSPSFAPTSLRTGISSSFTMKRRASADTSSSQGNNSDSNKEEPKNLAKTETQALTRLRFVLILMLVAACVVLSWLTFRYTKSREMDQQISVYHDEAERIMDAYYNEIGNKVWVAYTLAVIMSSTHQGITGYPYRPSRENLRQTMLDPNIRDVLALLRPNSWPYVTVPDFDGGAYPLTVTAQASTIIISPLVMNEDVDAFVSFASKMESLGLVMPLGKSDHHEVGNIFRRNGMINNSIENRTSEELSSPAADKHRERQIQDGFFGISTNLELYDVPKDAEYYFPIWEMSSESINRRWIMMDQLQCLRRKRALDAMMRYTAISLTPFLNLTRDNFMRAGRVPENVSGAYQEKSGSTILYCPVLSDLENRTVVGSIGVEFDWAIMFQNVVKEKGIKLQVKVVNSCNGEVRYLVSKDNVTKLNEDEYYEPDGKSEELAKRSTMDVLIEYWAERRGHILEPDSFHLRLMPRDLPNDTSVWPCWYDVEVHPSTSCESSNMPVVYCVGVVCIFIFTGLVFLFYDYLVERRQSVVMDTAVKSSAIVHSLFPAVVRERLFTRSNSDSGSDGSNFNTQRSGKSRDTGSMPQQQDSGQHLLMLPAPKVRLHKFLHQQGNSNNRNLATVSKYLDANEPIAEMFSNTTVLFADIAGFTAWSSEREPAQVFLLLETLYRAFDRVANRLGVFKVETIGDCYMAVTGCPTPARDHAVIMAQFALACLQEHVSVVRDLEATLGPGTSDLSLRIGLHSGPVTAGVLRGDKSRFQLFGDTVNVASRMESTGSKNRVQISIDTAELLREWGKEDWLMPRENLISVKGKGEMQTCWLKSFLPEGNSGEYSHKTEQHMFEVGCSSTGSVDGWATTGTPQNYSNSAACQKKERLIEYNTEILYNMLLKIEKGRGQEKKQKQEKALRSSVGRRRLMNLKSFRINESKRDAFGGHDSRSSVETVDSEKDQSSSRRTSSLTTLLNDEGGFFDEVVEVIPLPAFDPSAASHHFEPVSSGNSENDELKSQLRDYVSRIADLYHDVPFHNFEHASHVALSANKLIKRIVAPDELDYDGATAMSKKLSAKRMTIASDLHDLTFGISTDVLAQFSIVFSSLIHDVDHQGVPNSQLVKEGADIAIKYDGKSVAEQHSVQIALQMLCEPQYNALQAALYSTELERTRFRKLLINSVLATDIVDLELKALRDKRWYKAFHETITNQTESHQHINRKATIVIEHIIQASDVSHCMQHWHIFCRWNAKYFEERYNAFKNGRAEEDPSLDWYEDQMWFFDNYIIPLAKKLKECGVFGVSSDEYLNYAVANRREWKMKGEKVTEDLIRKIVVGREEKT